ncbi:MAG: hypothetical protein EA345_17195 [Halomonas sp.]|nr:MAG: hypothetical protein EA345_17195 [Halomonas sp.]
MPFSPLRYVKVNDALMSASDGQFEWTCDKGRFPPTSRAIELAGNLYDTVEKVVDQFQSVVDD